MLHHQLPIYKKGCELVSLAFNVQRQMPRDFKRSLGEKITGHCTEMVNLMALANATRGHERTACIKELLKLQHATTVLLRVSHDMRFISPKVWAARYVRYVDDFILLHESPQWLSAAHDRIEAFLPARLGARLNPTKTILQPVDRGVDFVGHIIKPWRRTTRPRTISTALNRIETLPAADIYATGNSYLGLVRQASASHKD